LEFTAHIGTPAAPHALEARQEASERNSRVRPDSVESGGRSTSRAARSATPLVGVGEPREGQRVWRRLICEHRFIFRNLHGIKIEAKRIQPTRDKASLRLGFSGRA
jgi:hypothetical protein